VAACSWSSAAPAANGADIGAQWHWRTSEHGRLPSLVHSQQPAVCSGFWPTLHVDDHRIFVLSFNRKLTLLHYMADEWLDSLSNPQSQLKGKGSIIWLLRAAHHSDLARFNEGSQFYLPPTQSSTSGMSHTCLHSPATLWLVLIFTARRNACIASAVLATAIPSVCPSYAGIVLKRRHVARCSLHRWIAKCV